MRLTERSHVCCRKVHFLVARTVMPYTAYILNPAQYEHEGAILPVIRYFYHVHCNII